MAVSVFDLFRVGIGPSSSHTVGPMRAALMFLETIRDNQTLEKADHARVLLMGSLAATGRGHGTDNACLLGLLGETPAGVDPDAVPQLVADVTQTKTLKLGGTHPVQFDPEVDIDFQPSRVPIYHTNALEFSIWREGHELYKRRYYSVGGGFVVPAEEHNPEHPEAQSVAEKKAPLPYDFKSGEGLLALAKREGKTIAELVRANEEATRTPEAVDAELDAIWGVMEACIARGFRVRTPLPGPLRVARRAATLKDALEAQSNDPLIVLDWVNAYAIAVSEENAAGGRVVTSPTNGAAGIVPAVIQYYLNHVPDAKREAVREFLLTAGAIGSLFKENASISGAEVGCQGEVGVACSMAAGGLTAVLGGTPEQIENAAEIAMEHHLGLTCDPIAGQVQIPCIERNAIGAVKAIAATRMALRGNGEHYVSLDEVMETMLRTGRDMQSKYKETSLGGLAVCVVNC